MTRELRVGEPDQSAASKTRLGSTINEEERMMHVYEPAKSRLGDRELHDIVESHFRIEVLGVHRKPRVSEVKQCAVAA